MAIYTGVTKYHWLKDGEQIYPLAVLGFFWFTAFVSSLAAGNKGQGIHQAIGE